MQFLIINFKSKIMQNTFSHFAGIDVSKHKLDVCLLHQDQRTSVHSIFSNTREGFSKLSKWIASQAISKEQVLFCLEHTGIYTMPLCLFLSKYSFSFSIVPALEVKRSIGVKRGKSDKVDAKAIAMYALLRKDIIELYHLPDRKLLKLKHLLTHRTLLVKLHTALQLSVKEREDFLEKEVLTITTRQSKELLKSIECKIKKTEDQILSLIKEDEQMKELYTLLLSIPGVGPITAVQLLVHTRLFTLFENARKFACYSGVAPFEHSSGKSLKTTPRVSHLANKKMKTLLNMAVLTSLKKDSQLKAYYERKLSEGKNKMLIINNLRNKLIQRIFATIKRKTPYVLTMQYAA
jgi:transposase